MRIKKLPNIESHLINNPRSFGLQLPVHANPQRIDAPYSDARLAPELWRTTPEKIDFTVAISSFNTQILLIHHRKLTNGCPSAATSNSTKTPKLPLARSQGESGLVDCWANAAHTEPGTRAFDRAAFSRHPSHLGNARAHRHDILGRVPKPAQLRLAQAEHHDIRGVRRRNGRVPARDVQRREMVIAARPSKKSSVMAQPPSNLSLRKSRSTAAVASIAAENGYFLLQG